MIRKAFLAALLLAACSQSAPDAAAAPARRPAHVEVAIFAGGCFWSAESDIEDVPGVVSAVSGFTGGRVAHPSYEQVSGGGTGHLEAVRVSFDPARVSYAALARRFMRTIDPTDPGGQFCDQGDNYRTALFVSGPAQREAALAAVADANRILRGRVVTPVRAAGAVLAGRGLSSGLCAAKPDRLRPLPARLRPRRAATRDLGGAGGDPPGLLRIGRERAQHHPTGPVRRQLVADTRPHEIMIGRKQGVAAQRPGAVVRALLAPLAAGGQDEAMERAAVAVTDAAGQVPPGLVAHEIAPAGERWSARQAKHQHRQADRSPDHRAPLSGAEPSS